MTRAEITKRIEKLEDLHFMLKMKDRWGWKDYETSRGYTSELIDLRKQLREMGE